MIVAIGGAARVGTTDAAGSVTVKVPLVSVPGSYQIVASFGGDTNYLPSSAIGGAVRRRQGADERHGAGH